MSDFNEQGFNESEHNEAQTMTEPAKKAGKKAAKKVGKKVGDKAKEEGKKASKQIARFIRWAVAGVVSFLGPLGCAAIALILILAILVGGASSSSAGAAGLTGTPTAYTPRLTAPARNNPYYYSNKNIFYASGYGMPNCTAYAYGRAYEILGTKPNLCTGNAGTWYDYNKAHNYYPYGKTPKVGAIAVWKYTNGGDGHVAVVEKIEDGVIVLSNSAWSGTTFYLSRANISDPLVGGNSWWDFQGYIYVFDDKAVQLSNVSFTISPNSHPVAQKIANYFGSRGLNKAAVCGILGNVYAECSFSESAYFAGYVPDALGAPGNSGGICQWYGDNCTRFKRDCPNWGTSVDAQIEYLYQTLIKDGQGSYDDKYYYWCTGTWDALKSAPNTLQGAREAAYDFCRLYERPASQFYSIRSDYAEGFWNNL